MALVTDASAALKRVVTDAGSDEASALLTDLNDGRVSLVAPEHVVGEVGNALRKRVGQGLVSSDDALAALDAIGSLGLEFVGGLNRWSRCLPAALDWGVTTADAAANKSLPVRLLRLG